MVLIEFVGVLLGQMELGSLGLGIRSEMQDVLWGKVGI